MNENDLKHLKQDADGLQNYEYLANHIDTVEADDVNAIVDNLADIDRDGQFCASAAKYLNIIDSQRFADAVRRLVALTIDKDREHRYLLGLMTAIYGEDYADHATELCAADNNFRRI
ncbi:MAG: hypothetical protein ACI4AX_02350, partial [Muribaculaceae bacterium]